MIILIIYGCNNRGIIILISAGLTEEPWMREWKLMVELTQIAKCSLCIVWTSPSAKRRVSCAHKHVRVLRTGWRTCLYYFQATKVIFVFSLMALLGKYAFRKQSLSIY